MQTCNHVSAGTSAALPSTDNRVVTLTQKLFSAAYHLRRGRQHDHEAAMMLDSADPKLCTSDVTLMQIDKALMQNRYTNSVMELPPRCATSVTKCRLSRRSFRVHSPRWPSVDLKRTAAAKAAGAEYQAPQRRLATSGKRAKPAACYKLTKVSDLI